MKLKNLFPIAVAATLFNACSADYLDTLPQSSTDTGTVFETTENARLAINGLCLMMTQQYLGQQGVNGEGTIKTWYGNYPGNDFQKCNLTGWADIINGTSFLERNSSLYCYYPWYYYYKLIGNANRIVANIDQASGPDAERLFIRAQALTVRAYAYLMLSQLYCHRWADSNQGASRGLPLRLDTSAGDLPASTLAQVYAQIYTDLDTAIDAYTRSGLARDRGDNHSPDLSVACAVYARAALTREDWGNAAKYAALARKDYPLMSNDDYVGGGFSTPNSEWIWSSYSAPDQTLYYFSFFAIQGSNSSASICRAYPCAISKELYDRIPESDVRRQMFLAPREGETYDVANGRVASGPMLERARRDYGDKLYATSLVYAYMQFKFLCTGQPGIGELNHFRAAEMYLIEAEANCHLQGKDADTQNLLKALVKDSGRDPQYTCTKTGADLLAEVKLYRRIELWGEGFDWFDLKRWREPIVRHAHPEGSFHAQFAVTVSPEEANQWTWVYPAKEVDYNGALDSYIE